jgi:aerobic-type carbon monoxide dehydrogenase small subunit (CoxS/CutS family)
LSSKPDLSRRGFLRGVGATGGALGSGVLEVAQGAPAAKVVGPGPVPITLQVNGKPHKLAVEPRTTLLDALRDQLDLTGAKRFCDHGTCGACTVMLAGKAVNACSVLAIDAQGKSIQTIEGLNGRPDPLVSAIVRNDAVQCGFCTPGFVMAAKALLARNPSPTEEQVMRGLGGNLCRCGTYVPMRKAILEAARERKGGRHA